MSFFEIAVTNHRWLNWEVYVEFKVAGHRKITDSTPTEYGKVWIWRKHSIEDNISWPTRYLIEFEINVHYALKIMSHDSWPNKIEHFSYYKLFKCFIFPRNNFGLFIVRLNSGNGNLFTFAIFILQKSENKVINADSEDIKTLVQFPGNSILKFCQFWNCVGVSFSKSPNNESSNLGEKFD